MKKRIMSREFFEREAEAVARDLLGKFICRRFDDGTVLRWCITETEAYDDFEAVTYKSEMFHGTGEWCPCYGMLMINCTDQGCGNVLIRALDCVKGPCKVADALEIKEIENEIVKENVIFNEKLWLEDWGATVKESRSKRVGIVKKEENDEDIKEKNYQAQAICFPFFE